MNQTEDRNGAETSTKVRKNITVPEELYMEFMSLGRDGESQPTILRSLLRMHKESHEELVSLRVKCDNYETAVTMLSAENDVLQEGIENFGKLRSQSAFTTPGQTSIGDFGGAAVKETMDAISDVCDDEVACVKTALHLIDKKAEVMEKQLDRDHSRTEKEKDRDHTRDEKDKDCKLKQDLELSRAEHQRKLALIKKGIVDESDLEGVVFLGSMEKRKTPGEQLADRKKRAYHAANNEGDDDFEIDGDESSGDESSYGDLPEEEYHD